MKWYWILILILLLACMFFNPKISVICVFREQLKIYKNDKTRKSSIFDYLSFIVVPILISLILAFYIPVDHFVNYREGILTTVSIIASVLLGFLAVLVDKKIANNEKANIVIKQTVVTITVNIIYALIVILLLFIFNAIAEIKILNLTCEGVIIFCGIKFILNILMIIKRIFKIFEVQ